MPHVSAASLPNCRRSSIRTSRAPTGAVAGTAPARVKPTTGVKVVPRRLMRVVCGIVVAYVVIVDTNNSEKSSTLLVFSVVDKDQVRSLNRDKLIQIFSPQHLA